MSCSKYEERLALNNTAPCANPWEGVFPAPIARKVAPLVLLATVSIIGGAVAHRRKWAMRGLVTKNALLTTAMLSAIANQLSSVFDYSRASEDPYCMTSMIPGLTKKRNQLAFGVLTLVAAYFTATGAANGSWDTVALAVPGLVIGIYQCFTKTDPRSCQSNAAVTGMLSFEMDVMTLTGLFATVLTTTPANQRAFALYSFVIAVATVGLVCAADYPKRVKDDCSIDDAADDQVAKKRRTPEFITQIVMSVANFAFVLYALLNVKGFGCCTAYPAIALLVSDLFMKFEMFNNRQPLVGSGMTRTVIYIIVQFLDIIVCAQTIVSILVPIGSDGPNLPSVGSVSKNVGALYFMRMVGSAFTMSMDENKATVGIVRRFISSVTDIGASLLPFVVDIVNANAVISDDPRILNMPCFIK